MKIAVVAADGRSGRLFVKRSLEAGHSVRAGIYGNGTLSDHERLQKMTCDATNVTDVMRLLDGQDAVVSFIGHVKNSPSDIQTAAMRNLVGVMKKIGLRRIVSLTGTGVRFAGDKITIVDRILNLAINIIDPARVRDGREHVRVLMHSDLDWTIIRVLKLQNTVPRPFSLLEHGPTKWYVSRDEVAQAVLQILENGSFVKKAPIIGKS